MKQKVLIVAIVMWVACAIGGGLWEQVEQYIHTRSIPPGQVEVQHLQDLYNAKLLDEVLVECDRAQSDPRCADYLPQIMYVRWAANRQTGRAREADAVQQDFLSRFPDHVLAADFHFGNAMSRLAVADYAGADAELKLICDRYPAAAIVAKAGQIRRQLAASGATTSPAR